MTLYAAYASTLHPEHMLRVAPHSPLQATGWLPGWRLTFGGEDRGWDGAMATVVEDPGSQVYVAVYDVTDDDEAALDDSLGVGIGVYQKIHCRVSTLDGDLVAWTHVLDDYEGGLPSAHYLGMVADAAEAAGAPSEYVAALRARPCRSVG